MRADNCLRLLTIRLGSNFQVGVVQWQVHSAQILGDKLIAKNKKEMLTTDERFVLVRFRFPESGQRPVGVRWRAAQIEKACH